MQRTLSKHFQMSDSHDQISDESISVSSQPLFSQLMDRMSKWIDRITTTEFKEFKRRQISYVLAEDFEHNLGLAEKSEDFIFDEQVDKQHQLVMSVLYLYQSISMLSQCEYYFRRYPFSELPVSREDHVRNICELYFGSFYIIRSRTKKVLNILQAACPDCHIHIGRFLKAFDREFSQEIRMRNGVIHHAPFGDLGIDRLFLTRMMSDHPDLRNKGWDKEHLYHYRKFTNSWSKRAKKRAADMQVFTDAICITLLERATFLKM